MDISTSQFNSASESGWTHYLDQSTFSENHFQKRNDITNYEEKGERMEESEEDLSMVSDASSGPPHYDDECYSENWCTYLSSTSKESQKKKKVKEYSRNQKHSTLDDTASSPFFNFPKESHKKQNGAVENAMDFSQCLSSTRIKFLQRKPKFQKNFRGTQASEEPGCLNEEQRK